MLVKLKNRYSLYSIIVASIAACTALLHGAFALFPSFSDFFNRYISSIIRACLSYLTYFIPFSLAETIILFMPFGITGLIILSVKMLNTGGKRKRRSKKNKTEDGLTEEEKAKIEVEEENMRAESDRKSTRYAANLFASVLIFYIIFTLSFAAGYFGKTLDQKLDLNRAPVTAEELYYTTEILLEKIDGLLDDVSFEHRSSSIMPYTRDEMNRKLNEAYAKASEKYSFIPSLKTKLKYIAMSEKMTYTHISGVYSYYTGETNINLNYPDYTIPFTAAHEMAHQRGIAREEEASFVAFLVCLESDDPYIRYSAYISVYEYVSSALYRADLASYIELWSGTDIRIKYEEVAFGEFFEKYSASVASKISGAVNDTYLKMQGQSEGSLSYNLVVDLAVAYYKNAY